MTTKKSASKAFNCSVNSFPSSDLSGLILLGVSTLPMPNVVAASLITFDFTSNQRPDGLSGAVTTPTMSNLVSFAICSKNGTPIGAEEKKTTL